MRLHERLRLCLLALASRYPQSVLDINESVLKSQCIKTEGWTPLEMIEQLEITAPQLLDAQACLVVDQQKSELYLEHAKDWPLFGIRCREHEVPRNTLILTGV